MFATEVQLQKNFLKSINKLKSPMHIEAHELLNDGCDVCKQHIEQKFWVRHNIMGRLYIENNEGNYEKILK